jgi:F-type H+-transporting ATPase subunit delta
MIQTAGTIEEASKYKQQLDDCVTMFQENANLYSALSSSWVGFKDKEKILNDFASQMELDEKVTRFIRIIIKNKRIDQFGSILETFGEMLDEMLNIKTIGVITPSTLSEEDNSFIKTQLSQLSGKDIKVENTVDPEILGGLKLILDGKVYDNSISSKLNSIKKSFLEA